MINKELLGETLQRIPFETSNFKLFFKVMHCNFVNIIDVIQFWITSLIHHPICSDLIQ